MAPSANLCIVPIVLLLSTTVKAEWRLGRATYADLAIPLGCPSMLSFHSHLVGTMEPARQWLRLTSPYVEQAPLESFHMGVVVTPTPKLKQNIPLTKQQHSQTRTPTILEVVEDATKSDARLA
jgi:hypothetical protein